jgi:cell wall-associated NlpC family hydrolase
MNLPEWTARHVGVPYETMDCWEFVVAIYAQEFGIAVGELGEQRHKIRDRDWTEVARPRPGEVILFKTTNVERHVAIVLNDDLMIHNQRGSNSCIERYTSNLWKHRLVCIYRHVARN